MPEGLGEQDVARRYDPTKDTRRNKMAHLSHEHEDASADETRERVLHPYYDPDADPEYVDAYSNRLVQFMGPTPLQAANPQHRSSRFQARRTGRRDDEIAALDPSRMTRKGASSLADHIASTGREELVKKKYPHLGAVLDAEARPEQVDDHDQEGPGR